MSRTAVRAAAALLAGLCLLLVAATPADALPGIPDCSQAGQSQMGDQSSSCQSLTGQIASSVTSLLENTVVKQVADELAAFTRDLIRTGTTWWLGSSSIRLQGSGLFAAPNSAGSSGSGSVPAELQGICLGVGVAIATLLVMFAGIKTALQRKGVHAVQALQGLFVAAVVSAVGVGVIDSLLAASDALTARIVAVGFSGKSADQVGALMAGVLVPTTWTPTMTLILTLLVLLVGLAHLCAMFLRQAALPIQALLLPIAGAGQVGGSQAREWLPRLYTSILVVIAYKPAAALLITVGFVELNNGAGLLDWVRGFVTLLLSVLALNALMGLFAPLGGAMAGATAGGGFGQTLVLAATSLSGALGGGRGGGPSPAAGGVSAVQHAQTMSRSGPAATAGAAGGVSGAVAGGAPQLAIAGLSLARAGTQTAASTIGGSSGDVGSASPAPVPAGDGGGGRARQPASSPPSPPSGPADAPRPDRSSPRQPAPASAPAPAPAVASPVPSRAASMAPAGGDVVAAGPGASPERPPSAPTTAPRRPISASGGARRAGGPPPQDSPTDGTQP